MRLISGLNSLENNTQPQLTVIIHSGVTQHKQNDFSSALQSTQRALEIRLKLFGEQHSSTAESYHSLGVTQHEQGDFNLSSSV